MIKNKKGFTLIELLVVIAIIALLATLAIISLTTAQRKARDTKRIADVKSVQSSVELYFSDNAAYPTAATYAGFETALTDYMKLPLPPDNDATDVYYYGTDATDYYVGTVLEDTNHGSMNDSSTDAVGGYTDVSWSGDGTTTSDDPTTPNLGTCGGAGFFCLGS